MRTRPFLAALLLASTIQATAATEEPPTRFWSDGWRGWHFYEDPEAESPPPKPAASPEKMPAGKPPRAPELVEFERLQKTLEDVRNIAIMRPTEANVRRYMELESQVVARAWVDPAFKRRAKLAPSLMRRARGCDEDDPAELHDSAPLAC